MSRARLAWKAVALYRLRVEYGGLKAAAVTRGDPLRGEPVTGVWSEMSPGVTYQVLFEDPVAKRRSMLVRALPGSTYESHVHDEGHEECLVLEGDFIMGDLKLLPGDFHLAAKGSIHPPATTLSGCLLYLSTPF
jgi:anti-sigma factor ChrR (cupin superfamily)